MPHAATQTGRRNERPAELPILHMNKGELNDFFCICAGLDALVLSAHEYRCRLCGKATCAGCPLCMALDNVLAFDRNGGSWATIDIREAM